VRREDRLVVWLTAIGIVVVIAAAGYLRDTAFYSALKVTGGDAGIDDTARFLHPFWPALIFGVPLVIIAAVLCRALDGGLGRTRLRGTSANSFALADPLVAAVLVAAVAGLAYVAGRLGFEFDFIVFVRSDVLRIAAFAAAIWAVLTVVAGRVRVARQAQTAKAAVTDVGAVGLVLLALAGGLSLVLADSWGGYLGRYVARGSALHGALLNPFSLHTEVMCLTPRRGGVPPTGVYIRLGGHGGTLVVLDPQRLQLLRVAAAAVAVKPTNDIADDCLGGAAQPPVDTATADSLAQEYRPILHFDSREPWRPLEIGAFLSETFTTGEPTHRICPPRQAPTRAPTGRSSAVASCRAASLGELRNEAGMVLHIHGSGSTAASPDPACHEGVRLDCDTGRRSAIYYHAVRAPSGRVLIDYWWFLRYNHFPAFSDQAAQCGGSDGADIDEHQGDWEGVTVAAPLGDSAGWVAYAAHTSVFRYRELTTLAGDARPDVYVACGSHASYPLACARNCLQTRTGCRIDPCPDPVSGRAEAPFDGHEPWGRNDDAACDLDNADQTCLRPLPAGIVASNLGGTLAAAIPFTDWPGVWGTSGGPRSPGLQKRFVDPFRNALSDRTDFGAAATPGRPPDVGEG
jgi:hypothetical protein